MTWWCAVTATEHVIRWSTAGAVVGVATVAAVASYEHAYVLVRTRGETGWTGRFVPLTVDGLIYSR
jgi:beta-glucanase (GH16 family)